MKKNLGTILIIGVVASLILGVLNYNQVTKLSKENISLGGNITAEKKEREKRIAFVLGELDKELEEKQSNIDSMADSVSLLEKSFVSSNDNTQSTLNDLRNDIAKLEDGTFNPAEIYEKSRRATVAIGYGSGFVYKDDMIVMTYHTLSQTLLDPPRPGTEISVTGSGFWSIAKVKKIKPEWDLAIIELLEDDNDPEGGFLRSIGIKPLKAASNKNYVGQPIAIIGNPFYMDQSLSTGVISALNRRPPPGITASTRLIQFDAPTYFGSSGSVLLNKDGEVIGMVVAALDGYGFGFAVPIDYIDRFLQE